MQLILLIHFHARYSFISRRTFHGHKTSVMADQGGVPWDRKIPFNLPFLVADLLNGWWLVLAKKFQDGYFPFIVIILWVAIIKFGD